MITFSKVQSSVIQNIFTCLSFYQQKRIVTYCNVFKFRKKPTSLNILINNVYKVYYYFIKIVHTVNYYINVK